MNVGADNPNGFHNELGELKEVKIYGVFEDVDVANKSAQDTYKRIRYPLCENASVRKSMKRGMATIVLEDPEDEMAYYITVEKELVQ
ncbi:hypothetical protein MMC28_010619 [Mycoblastus sanguinarius]|nr:hypothetical protein [Mycoblastus sanguinarius]